jgi:HK97 family phage prohead protease
MLAGSAGTAANEDHHHGHRMTTPAAAPPPVESSNADEVIAALGALLIAGTAAAAVIKLLGTLQGVTKAVVPALFTARKLGKLLGKKLTDPGQKAVTSAQIRYVAAQQQAMARAAYIVRATQRLAPAYATKDPAVIAAAQQREDTFAVAHAKAAADRQTAVNNLIKAVGKTKPDSDGRILMGWYAEPFPCPTCLLADGCDFDVLDPPSIGWPGWVHPHCHCTAGPPHGGVLVDDVVTRTEVPEEIRSLALSTEERASGLQATKNGRKLWKWLTSAEGTAHFAGSPHPWQALVDFLISKGVPAGQAKGEATNIMMATAAGKALFAKGHKGKKKRGAMTTEIRTAQITEIRGPGTAKPDARPGFTAKLVAYDVPDSYRTSWAPGVFTRALEQRSGDGRSIPVVWDHNWSDPVGQVVAYRDQADGFYGDVEFDDFDAVPRAKQAYAQMQPNPTTGKATMGQFSFAFVRGEEIEDPGHRGVMRQTSVDAVQEFSIVLNGSVPGTGVKAVRSAQTIDATTAAELVRKVDAGELDLTDALVELRGASKGPAAAAFEFRALTADGMPQVADPGAVLSAVDAALAGVAEQLDKGEVEASRRFFSQAASRLSELQYLLGMTPTVDGYGESYAWRAIDGATTEQRSEGKDQAPDDDVLAALAKVGRR